MLGGDDKVVGSYFDDVVDGGDGNDFVDGVGGSDTCTHVEIGPC
jgi:Ca2+-binding RTX toxin-like protein